MSDTDRFWQGRHGVKRERTQDGHEEKKKSWAAGGCRVSQVCQRGLMMLAATTDGLFLPWQ